MSRRALNHLLLSIVLLLSQQMAIAHVISHWGSRAATTSVQATVARDDGFSKPIAQDQGCEQCLAFAQIATAVGQETRSFAPPSHGSWALAALAPTRVCVRAPCAFRSRAPPPSV
ncbi:MAG: hypothetical protein ACXWJM_16160 [Ramlibacter sp.]